MELKQLYYFVETCKHKNFTATAAELFVTPQALNKSIKNLEQSLGAEVFYVYKNSLYLTEFGETLLEKGKGFIYDYQKLTEEMRALSRQNKGRLCLGMIPSGLEIIGSEFFCDFLNQLPDLELEILEMPNDKLYSSLLSQHIDIAITIYKEDNLNQFNSDLFYNGGISVVMKKTNSLFKREEIYVKDLKGQELVMHDDLIYVKEAISKKANENGFDLKWRLKSPYTDINRMFMHRVGCISLVPNYIAKKFVYTDLVSFRPLAKEEGLNWGLQIITSTQRHPSSLASFFKSELLKHCSEKLPEVEVGNL